MDNRQAIEFLNKYLDDEIYRKKCIGAHEMAIKALKKQVPTEPIRKSWELPRCPSCGAALGEWLGDGYTKDWESKTVCDCGQQIDWS